MLIILSLRNPTVNNGVMGEVLILQNTVPETLNSRTLHPVSWDGYPLKHTSDSQEMLGQVTLQLQIVKMATTAHCPIDCHLGTLPYGLLRNYWPSSPTSLNCLPTFFPVYLQQHWLLLLHPQSPWLWFRPWTRGHSLQTPLRSYSTCHPFYLCPNSSESSVLPLVYKYVLDSAPFKKIKIFLL